MFQHAADKYPEEAFTTKNKLKRGSRDLRVKAVEQALGINIRTKRGGFDKAILNLLAAIENYFSGRTATPTASQTPGAPASNAGRVAPVLPGNQKSGSATGVLPVGSKDSGVAPDSFVQEVQKRDPRLYAVINKNVPNADVLWKNAATHYPNVEMAIKHIQQIAASKWPNEYPGETQPGAEEQPAAAEQPGFDPHAYLQKETQSLYGKMAAGMGVSKEEITQAAQGIDFDALAKENGKDLASMSEAELDDFVTDIWVDALLQAVWADETGEAPTEEAPPEKKGGRQQTLEKLAAGDLGSETRQAKAKEELEKDKKKPNPVTPPLDDTEDERLLKDLSPDEQKTLLSGLSPKDLKALEGADDWTVGDILAYKDSLAKRATGDLEDAPYEDPGYDYQGYGDESEEPTEDEEGSAEPDFNEEGAYQELISQYPKLKKAAENLMIAIESRESTDEYFNVSDLGYDSIGMIFYTAQKIAEENGEKQARDFLNRILKDLKEMGQDDDEDSYRPQRVDWEDDDGGDEWGELESDRDDIENNMRREQFAEKIGRLRKKLLK